METMTERIKELLKVARQIERAQQRLQVLEAHHDDILQSLRKETPHV